MEEVLFGLDPGGPYAAPTAGTGATIDLWCNEDSDLLIVHNDPGDAVLSALEAAVETRDRLSDGGDSILVTDGCLKSTTTTVEPLILAHDCLLIPPLRYVDGRKLCRVWALEAARLTDLYHELRDEWTVRIEAKRSISSFDRPMPWLENEPNLSQRQEEAIRTAVERGYYEIPRQVRTAELGDHMGIERRTAETHLRLAEQKIIEAVLGYR